ncbi:hypothetical protein BJV78DRAFT_1203561 [Lactifluus subvellereus]|nr:hypothetical protein BJV78DRAFT_1203561 [Lactifluus subvellereus]
MLSVVTACLSPSVRRTIAVKQGKISITIRDGVPSGTIRGRTHEALFPGSSTWAQMPSRGLLLSVDNRDGVSKDIC